MKPKTELFLYQMLWVVDRVTQPTFRNLNDGFEAWAYRNGFLRQIQRLEAEGFLESLPGAFDESRVHRLTERGRRVALGGRDPEVSWSIGWDGEWQLILFDIPEKRRSVRRKLTRTLSALGYGCLQGSVWISPHRSTGVESAFPEDGADCSHLIVMAAESGGARADRQMVETAWDFERVNLLYEDHLKIVGQFPKGSGVGASKLLEWARRENEAWLEAVRADPLLPRELHPKGYLGPRAWRKRKAVLARAGRLAARVGEAQRGPC